MKGRVWVFDRGVVSEDNLQDLRQRGAYYLVGTPRRKLANFERELLEGDWQEVAGKPGVRVQLLEEAGETFVLARRTGASQKGVRNAVKSARAFATGLYGGCIVSWPLDDSKTPAKSSVGSVGSKNVIPRAGPCSARSNTTVAGYCGLGIRRACGEPGCAKAPIYCAPISIPWIPMSCGVNTCRGYRS